MKSVSVVCARALHGYMLQDAFVAVLEWFCSFVWFINSLARLAVWNRINQEELL